MMESKLNEVYPDKLSEYVSLCRSALNGVLSPNMSKKEKEAYGYRALKILNAIEAEYNGLCPDDDFSIAKDALAKEIV